MDAKNVKRMVHGLVAVGLFLIAGREYGSAGLTAQAGMTGGAGLLLLFSAITGKG